MNERPNVDLTTAANLLDRARGVRRNAYAPYSGFSVGAALLDEEGVVHTGVNVENVSYSLSTCAERSAVTRAVGNGARRVRAIAVAGPDDDIACMPCGSCRQILHEFGVDLVVIVAASDGGPRMIPLSDLLPEAFDSPGRGDRVGGP